MSIVLGDDRHDGYTGLDRQMERALLEGQQSGLVGVTPGAFGEDENTLAVRAHLIHSTIECLECCFSVGTVNKDSS